MKNNPHRQACEWIHSNEEFSRWSLPNQPLEPTSTPQLLWLSAIAGSGKTYLCARIIEESIDTGWDVAYFFCNINDESKRSTLGILKTLAYQLLRQNPGQLDIFSEAYNKAEQLGETFLGSAISRLIQGGTQCRLIIDGLDECDDTVRKSVLRLAEYLNPGDRMLIASRFEPDIEDDLEMLRQSPEGYTPKCRFAKLIMHMMFLPTSNVGSASFLFGLCERQEILIWISTSTKSKP